MLSVDGAQLAYTDSGTGPAIVLIHGTGAQRETWGDRIGELSQRHRVIAYDRRGYGESVHPPVRDYRRHVADAVAVLEHLAGPSTVVGWSSGGNIALAAAAARPDLVRSLLLVEAPFHGMRHATPGTFAAIGKAKLAQLCGRRQAGAAAFFRWASAYEGGGNGFDQAPPEEQASLRAHARNVLAELTPNPFGVMLEYLPVRRVAALPMPVTYLLGERSGPFMRKIARRLARTAPNIRFETIAGAGHMPHVEAPEAFIDAVERAAAATR